MALRRSALLVTGCLALCVLTGSPVFDALGSIVIGISLGGAHLSARMPLSARTPLRLENVRHTFAMLARVCDAEVNSHKRQCTRMSIN